MKTFSAFTLFILIGLTCIASLGASHSDIKVHGTPAHDLVGVKEYDFNDLVKVTDVIGDKKIFFRILSPEGLKYDAAILPSTDGNTFHLYAAMPNQDIRFLYGVIGEEQLFLPDEYVIKVKGRGPPPAPRNELQKQIDQIGLTTQDRKAAAAAISQALVSASGQDLINRAFLNLKPIVQKDTTKWTPFLVWLKAEYESNLGTSTSNEKIKQAIQELADAFAS